MADGPPGDGPRGSLTLSLDQPLIVSGKVSDDEGGQLLLVTSKMPLVMRRV